MTLNTALEVALRFKSAGENAFFQESLNGFDLNVGFQIQLGSSKKIIDFFKPIR